MKFLSTFSLWLLPLIIFWVPLYAHWRKVPVYDEFIAGVKEGLVLTWKILPFLIGIMAAISVFTACGAMDLLFKVLSPLGRFLGIPQEVLPLAFLRPLSGSGSLGLTGAILGEYGPDSFIGRLASVMQGSTETTLYVLAVYFGSVGITRIRYALWVGLFGDLAAFLAACFFSVWFFL